MYEEMHTNVSKTSKSNKKYNFNKLMLTKVHKSSDLEQLKVSYVYLHCSEIIITQHRQS